MTWRHEHEIAHKAYKAGRVPQTPDDVHYLRASDFELALVQRGNAAKRVFELAQAWEAAKKELSPTGQSAILAGSADGPPNRRDR